MDLILDLELLALGAMATLVGLLSVALMDHDGRFRLRRRMQLRLHRG